MSRSWLDMRPKFSLEREAVIQQIEDGMIADLEMTKRLGLVQCAGDHETVFADDQCGPCSDCGAAI